MKRYTLDTDASDRQVDCVLLQKQKDGTKNCVGYLSRTSTDQEYNFHERHPKSFEAFWVRLLLLQYLEGCRFILKTDRGILCSIPTLPEVNKKLSVCDEAYKNIVLN